MPYQDVEIGESSGTSETQTTFITKTDRKFRLPKQEGPTEKKGERNSERFISKNDIPKSSNYNSWYLAESRESSR